MTDLESTIQTIESHIRQKGHLEVSSKSIDLYFRFLFENKFSNSKFLLEVFEKDFFEIRLDIIDRDKLCVKWLQANDTITEGNDTLIILLLSHDEEDIRRGNNSPEKIALYDGLHYYAKNNISNFSSIFELIVAHKK